MLIYIKSILMFFNKIILNILTVLPPCVLQCPQRQTLIKFRDRGRSQCRDRVWIMLGPKLQRKENTFRGERFPNEGTEHLQKGRTAC